MTNITEVRGRASTADFWWQKNEWLKLEAGAINQTEEQRGKKIKEKLKKAL